MPRALLVCTTLTMCALLVGLSLAPRGAGAQISPGALARPHASFEGPRNCAKCHGGRNESVSQRCLGCHREIAWLRQQGQGFHARGSARGECSSCHPDHAGREFALIQWPDGSPDRFAHERGTGYALEQSHAEAKCTACHTTQFRGSTAATLSPRRAAAGWVGLETSCTSCHNDPHRGALEGTCTRCHDAGRWKDAPGFDHARTDYPLTGKHETVKCSACHLVSRLNPPTDFTGRLVPVFRPVPFKDCTACHSDPHQGRLTGKCTTCHATSGFKAIEHATFNHDRTRYPLRGKHAAVACASCHGGASVASPVPAVPGAHRPPARTTTVTTRTIMRPAYQTCTSCHTDVHGGQLARRPHGGACTASHSVDGWRPSTFGVPAHASLRFPLDGAHAGVACASCHASDRPGLPALAANAALGTARVVMQPPETTCAQCHADPHVWRQSAAAPPCTACHTTRTFRPTTMSASAHGSTGYRLEGAHLAVPCAGCHEAVTRPPPRSTLVAARPPVGPLDLRIARATCAGCHTDPHRGQSTTLASGACERCHTLRAFAPASLFDHTRDARFRLDGAHARAPCAACHRQPLGARPGSPLSYGGLSAACESCHAPAVGPPRPRP